MTMQWNENHLNELGSKALSYGDTTGQLWRNLIPQTIQMPINPKILDIKDIPECELGDYHSLQSLVNREPVRNALRTNSEDVLSATPIKLGNLEFIDLITQNGSPRAILATPNIDGLPNKTTVKKVFHESQALMRSAHSSSLRMTPGEYFHDETKGIAVREMITGHEELNINLNEDGQVFPRFLTQDKSVEKQNEAIESLSPECKSIFMAYAGAKMIGLRTLMALSTINPYESDISMFHPNSLTFASGDAMGKITSEGILSLQAVSFPWGAKPMNSLDDLIREVLKQDDAVYLDNGRKAGKRSKVDIKHQVPVSSVRESWVKHIVNWTVGSALEHLHQTGNQDMVIGKIGKLLSKGMLCNDREVKKSTSPYNTNTLASIAVHY